MLHYVFYCKASIQVRRVKNQLEKQEHMRKENVKQLQGLSLYFHLYSHCGIGHDFINELRRFKFYIKFTPPWMDKRRHARSFEIIFPETIFA